MTIAFASPPGFALMPSSPAQQFVVPMMSATEIADLLRQYTAWITLPPAPTTAVSRLPGLLRESRSLTGWSGRDLAEILHTSHTTVRRLETGGSVTARSRDTAARVASLHAVLVRLARVASSPGALGAALVTDAGSGSTPAELLREGQWSRAFTAALDVLQGPRPTILSPAAWPAPPMAATRELRY
jgi:transcriptional regulator with XRE-family HTH domain